MLAFNNQNHSHNVLLSTLGLGGKAGEFPCRSVKGTYDFGGGGRMRSAITSPCSSSSMYCTRLGSAIASMHLHQRYTYRKSTLHNNGKLCVVSKFKNADRAQFYMHDGVRESMPCRELLRRSTKQLLFEHSCAIIGSLGPCRSAKEANSSGKLSNFCSSQIPSYTEAWTN